MVEKGCQEKKNPSRCNETTFGCGKLNPPSLFASQDEFINFIYSFSLFFYPSCFFFVFFFILSIIQVNSGC